MNPLMVASESLVSESSKGGGQIWTSQTQCIFDISHLVVNVQDLSAETWIKVHRNLRDSYSRG